MPDKDPDNLPHLLVGEPVHLLTGSITIEDLLTRTAPLLRVHLSAGPTRKLVHVHVSAVQERHDVEQGRLTWGSVCCHGVVMVEVVMTLFSVSYS